MIKSLGLKTHLRDASDILSPSCWHNPVHVALNLKRQTELCANVIISHQLTYVLKSYDNSTPLAFLCPFWFAQNFVDLSPSECTNLKFQSHPHRQFSGSICRFHAADMKVKLVTMSSANLLTPFRIQTLNTRLCHLCSIMSSSRKHEMVWFAQN